MRTRQHKISLSVIGPITHGLSPLIQLSQQILVILFLSILISCDATNQPTNSVIKDIYWFPEMQSFFEQECGLCHDDPPLASPIPLKSYAQVKAKLDRIAIRTLVSHDMPPGGLDEPYKKDLLQQWINQGAPEKNEASTPLQDMMIEDQMREKEDDGQIRVTWQSHIQGVFNRYCNGCHQQPTAGGAPYSLLTYQDAIHHLDEIRASVIENGTMPPPNGLIDEEVFNLILTWLDNGALED